ncbi:hypothetical protein BJ508DRAFT_364682 [Ascobolus immersus RN42]|uniref:F-box domain-containing protein n=1 Tax=Ascobolus immersus RN42 TaxID=1160509 RepID=A0A3N4HYP1_ASCIM|nr:hypothetical protein BJ508DRAFT_364682 [Ascobolus immersus RN42]
MQSAFHLTNETTTTSERPPPELSTTSTQHGIEGYVPFDAGPQYESGIRPHTVSRSVSEGKGKGREVLDVNSSDEDDRSLPGSVSPISPGERIRLYESNCGTNSPPTFASARKDVSGKDYSLLDNVPNEILIQALSYLDPLSLNSLALVSRRFSSLVASPYVWRSAFLRFFPGAASEDSGTLTIGPDRRYFSCLTPNSTWKKEYLLRTTLLRSFAKGKALDMSARSVKAPKGSQSLMITYDARCNNITHISVKFPNAAEPGGAKALPRLYAGSTFSDRVTISDYTIGKKERALWDTPGFYPPEFHTCIPGANSDYFCPNSLGTGVMDLSEGIGWVLGETIPNGRLFVFAHCLDGDNTSMALHGHRVARPLQLSDGDYLNGNGLDAGISSVWIAKSRRAGTILDTSEGKIGVLSGSSKGCLSVFSLPQGLEMLDHEWNLAWASWYICPGIPILSVHVDNEYSSRRKRRGMPWCVVVNAIGEIWYSTTLPTPNSNTANWHVIPSTLQPRNPVNPKATPKQYAEEMLLRDWRGLRRTEPMWGNDWWIEVDWADETVIRGRKLLGSTICRFHRTRAQSSVAPSQGGMSEDSQTSIFGGSTDSTTTLLPESATSRDSWLASALEFSETFGEQHLVTAVGLDNSYLCQVAAADRPEKDIPGSNARLLAIGTDEGVVFVWNIRDSNRIGSVYPLRRIQTQSPKITTVAVSSLLVVSGGTDGLVVAYDPLSSSDSPVRVIHSRLTSRARRRLAQLPEQNVSSPDNQYAARACVLDPEPTSLRGVVALGAHIRHWSIASDSADNSARRRKKKLARQALAAASRPRQRDNGSKFKGLIHDEFDVHQAAKHDSIRHNESLEKRFGISFRPPGANDLTEEELLAYAELLSKEAYNESQLFNGTHEAEVAQTPVPIENSNSEPPISEEEAFARDLDAAIAASLATEGSPPLDEFEDPWALGGSSSSVLGGHGVPVEQPPNEVPDGDESMDEDLMLALKLSLVEC